jgi:hypothetical protein
MKQGRSLFTHRDNNKKVRTLHFVMFKNKYLVLCWCSISGVSTRYHWRRLSVRSIHLCSSVTSILPSSTHLCVLQTLEVSVHTDKLLQTETQMTDPTSQQRGCPTETRKRFPHRNLQMGNNVWSQALSGLGTKTY